MKKKEEEEKKKQKKEEVEEEKNKRKAEKKKKNKKRKRRRRRRKKERKKTKDVTSWINFYATFFKCTKSRNAERIKLRTLDQVFLQQKDVLVCENPERKLR